MITPFSRPQVSLGGKKEVKVFSCLNARKLECSFSQPPNLRKPHKQKVIWQRLIRLEFVLLQTNLVFSRLTHVNNGCANQQLPGQTALSTIVFVVAKTESVKVHFPYNILVFFVFSWQLCVSVTSWSRGSTTSWWRTRAWMAAPPMWTSCATYTKRSGIYLPNLQRCPENLWGCATTACACPRKS